MIAATPSRRNGKGHVDLKTLKASVDLLALARSRGHEPKRHGNEKWAMRCPFHDDQEASLVITPARNLWHCFGCDKGGSVIDFVALADGITTGEAIRHLTEKSGGLLRTAAAFAAPPAPPPTTPERQKLLNKAAEFYHKAFLTAPEGRAYLRGRGLTDAALYEAFRIGYADGTILDAIPPEGDVLEELKGLGILDAQGREHFRDCVVFPIADRSGNVVEMYGRKTIEGCKVKHLYLPGPHRGVWNAQALRMPTTTAGRGDRAHAQASFCTLLLTESIIDAAALWQAGWRHTIPCYGTNGLTPEHVALIRDSHVERLVLVMDGDEAGRRAVEAIRKKLDFLDAEIRAVTLPEGEDPASYLQTHSAEDFGKLLAEACDAKAAAENTLLAEAAVTPTANGFRLTVEKRTYEVFGTEGKPGKVRATVKAVTRDRLRFHIDTVDLYQARSRKAFAADAARLYGLDADAIGLDLNRIIEAAEKHLAADDAGPAARPGAVVSPEAEKEARAFGRRPDLLDAIARDVERCGYVGERSNVLAAYLTMTGRKMLDPLALLILSGSGAGKSALQNTVLSLCPEEDLVKLTSLTERALFYKDEQSLKHKVLALEEVAGGEDASYAIRSLISQGELVIEATVKDPATGRMTTMQNKVYGPTAVFETTTNPDVDPETKSRFMLASIDESREQTRKILDAQRKARTVEGLRSRLQRDAVREKHHAFQRMLRPLDVRNPYGELLTYTDDRLLMRRDNPKYLALIDAVAFLHQLQKPVKRLSVAGRSVEYIEVSLRDIALANELAAELLGRSLDELSGPSRRLLQLTEKMVTEWTGAQNVEPGQIEFTRRQLREHTRWSDYQVRTHLAQLVELEYVAAVSGRFGQQYQYRLLWDGQGRDGGAFLDAQGVADLRAVTREHVRAYQAALMETDLTTHTVHARLRAVRRLYDFLEAGNRVLMNPAAAIRMPKLEDRLPRNVMTKAEVRRLLDAPDTSLPVGIRDKAMLEVFYSTGLRLAELCGLTVHDVDVLNGYVRVNNGKGCKDRVVPLGRVAGKCIESYVNGVRPELLRAAAGRPSATALFLSARGLPLSRTALASRIEHYARAAGLSQPVTPHTFRHSCATHMIRNRANLRHVQEMLGHKNLNTTEVYLHLTITDLKEAHHKFHPREKDA